MYAKQKRCLDISRHMGTSSPASITCAFLGPPSCLASPNSNDVSHTPPHPPSSSSLPSSRTCRVRSRPSQPQVAAGLFQACRIVSELLSSSCSRGESVRERRRQQTQDSPLLHFREGLRWQTRPFRPVDPGKATEIRDRVLSSHEPQSLTRGLLRLQTVIEDLVQTFALGLIAIDRIVNLLRGVAVKVVRCSFAFVSAFKGAQRLPLIVMNGGWWW